MLAKGRVNFRDVDPSCVFLPNASRFASHPKQDIPSNVAMAPVDHCYSSIDNPKLKSPKVSLVSTFETGSGWQNTNEQW